MWIHFKLKANFFGDIDSYNDKEWKEETIQQAMISLQGMEEFYVYMNIVWLYLSKTLFYVNFAYSDLWFRLT